MDSYPLLLDFIIDIKNENPIDYWNYYSFGSQITNNIDFDYRKIIKNQGFFTEILLKSNDSLLDEAGYFMSVTKERLSWTQKKKNRKILPINGINLHRLYKNKTCITKNYHPLNGLCKKYIMKKTIYQRKQLNKQKLLFSPSPKLKKITIKIEEPQAESKIKLSELIPTPSANPSYNNFILLSKDILALNSSIYSNKDLQSLYLINSLFDVHFQPERKSNYEKSKDIIYALPPIPRESQYLPVLNDSIEIDYKLLHLTIVPEFSKMNKKKNQTKRLVFYQEQKSLNSLADHFKMPKNELDRVFNGVSRYIPDLMEVFKGNSKIMWSCADDDSLKFGQIILGKDQKIINRRIRFLSLFNNNIFKDRAIVK